MSKDTVYLEDVTFDFEDSEGLGPHLAYTLDINGGAASGHNKPLLFKSEYQNNVTQELVDTLKSVGVNTEKLEKQLYASDKARLIETSLKEKEFVGKYDCLWVVDYNDTSVVFVTEDGMFAATLELTETSANISDVAVPVITRASYVEVDGKVLISDDLEDKLESGMYDLVAKSVTLDKVQSVLKAVTKKVGDETLTANDYAYVPDKEKPSTWKLRIDDARHTAAAVAALGEGFRGNKVEIPEADLPSVKAKVKKAYKKFYPDNELPEIIKSADLNTNTQETFVADNVDVTKSAEYLEVIEKMKEMEQKVAKALEIEKAAQEVLKAKEEADKQEILNKASAIPFIADEDKATVGEFLLKAKGSDLLEDVLSLIEKANAKIKSVEDALIEKDKEIEQVKKDFGTAEHGQEQVTQQVTGEAQDLLNARIEELKKAKKA